MLYFWFVRNKITSLKDLYNTKWQFNVKQLNLFVTNKERRLRYLKRL
jgi:hypothetical protein